ncbi:hypothetical protein QMZ30_15715 [Pantoea sp. EA-12]|nr:hypothetical protein [Pantoea sp. EA-12]MDI9222353.1 hypothetical protein [Pantoea sp. EA-12]
MQKLIEQLMEQAQRAVASTNALDERMSGQFVNDLRDAVYQGLREVR